MTLNDTGLRWELNGMQAEIDRLRADISVLETLNSAILKESQEFRVRNDELVTLLRSVEWIEPEPTPRAEPYCLWCEAVCDNHAPDCALDAALRRGS